MEHITMKYGQPCNYMRTTNEEYRIISAFLKGLGIETRKMVSDSESCEWQARNAYKVWGRLAPDGVGGKWICQQAEKDIESGHWCR